jgi:hypothetical protein
MGHVDGHALVLEAFDQDGGERTRIFDHQDSHVATPSDAAASQDGVEVTCPTDPVGPDGEAVSDQFYFVHQPLGENGSITVRMTSMTGTITYPPPNHDEIVAGLVPWAKGGIIIKDGLRQGSSYAALMVTGSHGVRMQYDYTHDIAGRSGGVSAGSPRWLRLTRAGDTITGYESAYGREWSKVGTATLAGLPSTVQVGLFATSPGDLSLQRVGLGAGVAEVRFTQTVAAGSRRGEWHLHRHGHRRHRTGGDRRRRPPHREHSRRAGDRADRDHRGGGAVPDGRIPGSRGRATVQPRPRGEGRRGRRRHLRRRAARRRDRRAGREGDPPGERQQRPAGVRAH